MDRCWRCADVVHGADEDDLRVADGETRHFAAQLPTHVATEHHQGDYYAPRRKIGKGSPHSIAERRVPELIPVLGSQS